MTRPILLAIAAAIALSGCGERKETVTPTSTKTLRVALPPLNAGEAALFAADNEQAGLNVTFAISADPATPISKLTQGRVDLAVSTEPALLEARGKGARVVSVAALTQSPFTALIGPKLSVGTALDLATKPIGTEGLDYQKAMADTIFTKAHVVNVASDPAKALSSKKVAAVIAPFGGPALPPGVTAIPVDLLKVPPTFRSTCSSRTRMPSRGTATSSGATSGRSPAARGTSPPRRSRTPSRHSSRAPRQRGCGR